MGLVIRGVLGSLVLQLEPNDKADGHLTYTIRRGTIGGVFPVLAQGFDAISRALGSLQGAREMEVLNIGVNTTFAMGWLLPRVAAFRTAYPDIDLRVSTHNNRVEILRDGLDMAIRFGSGGWSGHDTLHLIETPLSPLCAPHLAGQMQSPEDLTKYPLLRSYRSAEWSSWFASVGLPFTPVFGPVLDSSISIAELASAGEGVALLPVAMFARNVADGRLVCPFAQSLSMGSYYLGWWSERAVSKPMQSFIGWISSEIMRA